MTDIHPPGMVSRAASGRGRFAALPQRSRRRSAIVRRLCRALEEVPDNLLSDIGIRRSDIPVVAEAVAFEAGRPIGDTP